MLIIQSYPVHKLPRPLVLPTLNFGNWRLKREFHYVEDIVDACVHLMLNYNEKEFVNIGCGEYTSIKDYALLVKEKVEFKGVLIFADNNKFKSKFQNEVATSRFKKS